MRIVQEFPHRVREIEPVWIPMSDGCRLAARLWLPESAEQRPVPAILETGPYRKRDGTRERDERMHRWFAGHGYACLRVDIRGSGDSDGILEDEYTAAEQRDNVAVIEWLASQRWCDGAVGMIGKSWGGFAALQAAAMAPPALRAVIVVCASEDRFATDAHWMGGCPLVENLTWGAMCMTLAVQPPGAPSDPEAQALWEARLDAVTLLPAAWLRHSTRDAYWRSGSIGDRLGDVRCAVYAVSGWADAYVDAVPRLLAGLRGPRKGLVGPWAHAYPHEATPEPAIGFLQEAKRWWDRYLRGEANGIDAEPVMRVWMQEHARAGRARDSGLRADAEADDVQPAPWAPGRWVAEAQWPSSRIERRRIALHAVVDTRAVAPVAAPIVHTSEQTVGAVAPPWCAFGFEAEAFPDQAADDGRSIVLETQPLEARIEILGAPRIVFEVEVDRPVAQLAVRLCDVAPGEDAVRVSYAVADLGLVEGGAARRPVVPGGRLQVPVELRHAAHTFAPGHRIRIAISTAYWPIVWPSPEPVTVTLHAWDLALPVRPADPHDVALARFAPPECAAMSEVEENAYSTIVTYDEIEPDSGAHVVTTAIDMDPEGAPLRWRYPATHFEAGHGSLETFRIAPQDPGSASAELHHRVVQNWAGDETEVELRVQARADGAAIGFEATLRATHAGAVVRERRWQERVEIPGRLLDRSS